MAQVTLNNGRWELAGDVGIDVANQILQDTKALSLQEVTDIDFAKVTDIDTASISLILEWKRRAIAEHKRINFVNLPNNLLSLAQLYGVKEIIS